jgi:tRNA1(Val) A37 N6-methylase TrmN6
VTTDLTRDAFLDGRLNIWQPARGYRAGVDPVFLAASVLAHPGQSVLELGCGVGVASLCLQERVGGLRITGLELQADYADLARRNADDNGLEMVVETGDLQDMPATLRAQSFDHVIANPPYFQRARGTPAGNTGRDLALAGDTSLDRWIDAAVRRLAPKGRLTVIQKADRLPDLLSACDARVGNLRVLPLASRIGRPADRVILQAQKGARGAFRLLPAVVLHDGDRHERDGESYTPAIDAILRKGAEFKVDWR